MIKYLIILFLTLLFCNDNPRFADRDFVLNGNIDSAVKNISEQQNLKLVQIDAINDSLLQLVNITIPNLELYAGPSSYHRIISTIQYERLLESISSDYINILNENYIQTDTRNYWAQTIQGDDYYGSSGDIGNTCSCLDTESCVVVGFNDSWYNPFDYYGEVWWNFIPPEFDEIVEARLYVQGAQCDVLPVYSESNASIRNNGCSWNGGFQVTLSTSYTLNGPYIIPDELLNDIWCEGNMQPVVGSEDNYSVDFVRMELLYSCPFPDGISNFDVSDEEFCDYIELNWSIDETATGYYLYKDGNLLTQLSNDINQFSDYQAIEGEIHNYCLVSINPCGESEPICLAGSRKSSPEAIDSINASDGIYQNYIFIEWTALDEEVYYKLYRDGSQLTVIASGQELSYDDQFVETQEVYEYCVEAINDCGESEWSCDFGFVGISEIGDINIDSAVDVLDVVLLLNFILEYIIPTDDQLWLSDINGDNILNVLDIISLVNIILD